MIPGRDDRRFRDLLRGGLGMTFFPRDAGQNVFNVLSLIRGCDKKERFDAFELIQAQPMVVFGNDILFSLFDRIGKRGGKAGEDALCPGRPVNGNDIDIAIVIRSKHDSKFISDLRVATSIF